MHLLSEQRMSRLKSNKRAYEHFQKYQETYRRYAKDVASFTNKYPEMKNEETRVNLVASWIVEFDKSLWGLKTDYMTAQEIAETYSRLVVGHEN